MLSCDQLLRGSVFITNHQQYVFYGRSFYIFMCIHDFVCLYSGPVAVLCVWWIQCCFLQGEKKEFCDCNLDLFVVVFTCSWYDLCLSWTWCSYTTQKEGGLFFIIFLKIFWKSALVFGCGVDESLSCLPECLFLAFIFLMFMLGVELVYQEFWYYCHCSINNL